MKNTNISVNKSTFLDLTISIYRNKFLHYSWDKRKEFNFQVVNYPNLSGNIPTAQSYGVYTSELIRFCDININFDYFVKDVKMLTAKFLNQSFKLMKLKDKFLKFRNLYFFKWAKFDVDISIVANKLFNIETNW